MPTEVMTVHLEFPERDKIVRCAKIIRQGGLVVFPTETVYGIAADFNNAKAMQRLRDVKKRTHDKPFSIHIAQKGLISNYTPVHDPVVYKLIDEYWPGPLTVVVPAHEEGQTIGIRMPNHMVAIRLIEEAQCTIAAPSANFQGNPPPSTCQEALRDLDCLVDLALDAGPAKFGQASSVVDLTRSQPTVIREGVISQADVDRISRRKTILFVCTGNSCRSVMAEYLLRDMLRGRDDVEVISAGTSVFLRSTASAETLTVLRKEGIDACQHQSQGLNNVMLKKADLIFVMTKGQRQQVLERVPDVENRVYLLREFATDPLASDVDMDIPDPMGRPAQAYEECLVTVKNALGKVIGLI